MADNGLKDRRLTAEKPASLLRAQLNDAQQLALAQLERYGWEIQFVRRPLFQDPVPVLIDGDRKHYGVLTPEGELDETQGFSVRRR